MKATISNFGVWVGYVHPIPTLKEFVGFAPYLVFLGMVQNHVLKCNFVSNYIRKII